jgi:hypothetical protein
VKLKRIGANGAGVRADSQAYEAPQRQPFELERIIGKHCCRKGYPLERDAERQMLHKQPPPDDDDNDDYGNEEEEDEADREPAVIREPSQDE